MEIVTLQEARSQGLKTYFTGRACKHGHLSEYRTASRGCCECLRLRSNDWKKNNSVKNKDLTKKWRLQNSVHLREYERRTGPARCAKRRASKLQATPPWANLEAIEAFYLACPNGFHVDHIVPLRHPLICGLHTIENLQYLTAEENLKKGNLFEESLVPLHILRSSQSGSGSNCD